MAAASGRSVLLLPPDGKQLDQIRTLLVPVDGTARGARLDAAAILAGKTEARLELLEVVSPAPLCEVWYRVRARHRISTRTWEKEEPLRRAERYLESLQPDSYRRRVFRSGIERSRASCRQPSTGSANETDADIVVTGTHAPIGLYQ